jgi:hypothetical protein
MGFGMGFMVERDLVSHFDDTSLVASGEVQVCSLRKDYDVMKIKLIIRKMQSKCSCDSNLVA